jgi:hypothetical protein
MRCRILDSVLQSHARVPVFYIFLLFKFEFTFENLTHEHCIYIASSASFKGKGKQLEEKMVQQLQEDVDMEEAS